MADFIAPPRPHELLPPLLACLQTAFMSPRPPPDMLPLLAPTLRQRVHMLSIGASGSDSWLPLLSWNSERASRLPGVVERLNLEPHPVSGEIEIEDPKAIQYQRLDPETLQARLELEEYELLPVYLWCLGDGAGNEQGWKLTDLRTLEDNVDGTCWYGSISEADERLRTKPASQANGNEFLDFNCSRKDSANAEQKRNDDDDDSYWSMYDRTPSQTPNIRPPVAQASNSVQAPSADELAYFARYMQEQQSTIDDEDGGDQKLPSHESTLNGNSLISQRPTENETVMTNDAGLRGSDSSVPALSDVLKEKQPEIAKETSEIRTPSPRVRTSGSFSTVDELESRARSYSCAEVGIKQHIAFELKSLYRLSKTAGIDRDEFQRLVQTELDCLRILDQE